MAFALFYLLENFYQHIFLNILLQSRYKGIIKYFNHEPERASVRNCMTISFML